MATLASRLHLAFRRFLMVAAGVVRSNVKTKHHLRMRVSHGVDAEWLLLGMKAFEQIGERGAKQIDVSRAWVVEDTDVPTQWL